MTRPWKVGPLFWWRWGELLAFLFRLRGTRKRNRGIHRCAHRWMHTPPACAMMIQLPSLLMKNISPALLGGTYVFGGGEESWTPVRKHFNRNFSGRRRLFAFPRPSGSRHPQGLGSFIMHGVLKALHAHVHHWSTLHPGPWYSRVERSLIKQREELYRCCSLIYKSLPVLRMSGASARYSCLHAPVETVTPPRRQTKPIPFRFRGLRKCPESSISIGSVFLTNLNPLALGFKLGKR